MLEDIRANRNNIKGLLFICSFRLASYIRKRKVLLFFLFPIPVFHIFIFSWLLGFDVPLSTTLGQGISFYHGLCLVINANAVIGNNCVLRHGTTIGNVLNSKGEDKGSPVIGNNCEIGCNVVILGPIKIGHNVRIGAGTIVVKDVPSNSVVIGNPMIIKTVR